MHPPSNRAASLLRHQQGVLCEVELRRALAGGLLRRCPLTEEPRRERAREEPHGVEEGAHDDDDIERGDNR